MFFCFVFNLIIQDSFSMFPSFSLYFFFFLAISQNTDSRQRKREDGEWNNELPPEKIHTVWKRDKNVLYPHRDDVERYYVYGCTFSFQILFFFFSPCARYLNFSFRPSLCTYIFLFFVSFSFYANLARRAAYVLRRTALIRINPWASAGL